MMRENRSKRSSHQRSIWQKTTLADAAGQEADDRQAEILDLQRAAGNQAVAHTIQEKLGSGVALPASIRSRIGNAYGANLSDVRLHTDSNAAKIAQQHQTSALTVGNDIVFDQGRYEPGTLMGDALIAHELAHVAQQQQAQTREASSDLASTRLEQDANRSALGGVLSMARRTASGFSSIVRESRPRMKSAIQVQRASSCFSSTEKIKAPDYLGPKSLEALEEINRILESIDLLGKVIVYGTAVNIATGNPADTLATGGHDVSPQAEALKALPVIQRSRVLTVIDLLLVSEENNMNEQERKFWYRLREAFTQ